MYCTHMNDLWMVFNKKKKKKIATFSKNNQKLEHYLIEQQDRQKRRKYESLHVFNCRSKQFSFWFWKELKYSERFALLLYTIHHASTIRFDPHKRIFVFIHFSRTTDKISNAIVKV